MSKPTSSETDTDRALRSAMRVFVERGFAAASMSDLVAATGMNRAALYATFGSKHQLYITALARYREDSDSEIRAIVKRALDRSSSERLDVPEVLADLLDVVLRHSKHGSLEVRAAVELADDSAVRQRVLKAWSDLEQDLTEVLTLAARRGEIRMPSDPVRLARAALVFIQGAFVVGRANSDERLLSDAVTGLIELFGQLSVDMGQQVHGPQPEHQHQEDGDSAGVELEASIWLGDGANHQQIEQALMDLLAEAGMILAERGDPEHGSWFRRLKTRARQASSHLSENQIIAEVERKIRLEVFDKAQDTVDHQQSTGAAALITALQGETEACIQVGSLLLLKSGGKVAVRNLTQLEMAWLERNPTMLRDPASILEKLQEFAGSDSFDERELS